MALHIADAEVTTLVAELAKLDRTTKTEALRQLLRKNPGRTAERREGARFYELAMNLIARARSEGVAPVTKEEMDDLWGMDELDRHSFVGAAGDRIWRTGR